MAVRIQLRNGLASEWTTSNPVLMQGEVGLELDTKKSKIGNGINTWNELSYGLTGEQGPPGADGLTTSVKVGTTAYTQVGGVVSLPAYPVITGKQDKLIAGTNITITGTTISATDTNTVTSINGKTGVIAKADIVALGIPAQDTVYTHPPGTNPHGTTKSDVGLGNVTNDKQMPISGGILESYTEKLTTVTGAIDLNLGNVFYRDATDNTTFSITNAKTNSHSFTLYIDMGATVKTMTFPASVKWHGDEVPDMTAANKTYELMFTTINSGTKWMGHFGGAF